MKHSDKDIEAANNYVTRNSPVLHAGTGYQCFLAGLEHKQKDVDELVEALENMTRYHEKMASWDKGDNGYYKAKKLIQKHKR